jgi:hypothetical protein
LNWIQPSACEVRGLFLRRISRFPARGDNDIFRFALLLCAIEVHRFILISH